MAGFTGAAQPSRPVGRAFSGDPEFLTPAREIELHLSFPLMASERVNRLIFGVRDGARECVAMGCFADTGHDGVLLDVEQGCLVLGRGGNVLGLEVVAPKVPIGMSQAIHVSGMIALQMLHQARDGTLPLRLEHEVDVVVHEAKGMDPDFVTAGELIEPVQVKNDVGFAIEDPLALRSALIDMVDLTALKLAKTGR